VDANFTLSKFWCILFDLLKHIIDGRLEGKRRKGKKI